RLTRGEGGAALRVAPHAFRQGRGAAWTPRAQLPPMGCDGFRARVHLRFDLGALERAAFDRHASICRACARLLIEVERLDDLLLAWQAPARPQSVAGSPTALLTR